MLSIGLTGGIASGKSTVVNLLKLKGADIIDLDELARVVVQPGQPALEQVRQRFGPEIITAEGTLDRAALGKIVFDDAQARQDLEDILHPAILLEERQRVAEFTAENPRAIIITDVPLLFEIHIEGAFEAVILVYAPREVQKARLMTRDGFTAEEAEKRLNAQMSIEEKRARATYVIDNSGDLYRTRRDVDRIWEHLIDAEAAKHEEQTA